MLHIICACTHVIYVCKYYLNYYSEQQ
jgi:hypothetical protein